MIENFLNTLTPHTRRAYTSAWSNFGAWWHTYHAAPLTDWRDITHTDVRQWRDSLAGAPATVNARLAALGAWGRWAVAGGHIPDDPTHGIKGARQQATAPRGLSPRGEAALMREIEREINHASPAWRGPALRLRAVIALMLYAGLRVGEVIALRPGDIEINPKSGWVLVGKGKGNKRRRVPLPLRAREAVAAWLPFAAGPRLVDIGARDVQHHLARLSHAAGVEATPHTLRHTYAHRLRESGAPLEHIAALLGHSSIRTTTRYTWPGDDDLARTVGKLD